MSRLTQIWKRQEYGSGTGRRNVCVLGLILSLTLLTNACGALSQGQISTLEPMGNGGVILGETRDAAGSPLLESSPLPGNGDLISDESMYNPTDTAEIFISANEVSSVAGNGKPAITAQTSPATNGTGTFPTETSAAEVVSSGPSPVPATPESVVPVKASPEPTKGTFPEATKDPLPVTSATGSIKASADTGIIIRSGNILSTSEKEVLLNQLETELNGLFGAIDQVSAEQQAKQAE